MSVDGKIALPSGKQIKLSSLEDFKRVHELRNYCDGVLVGINTILTDDPKLMVKSEFVPSQKHPIRIVLDTNGRTPKDAAVLDGKAPTIIVISDKLQSKDLSFKNSEIIYCPSDSNEQIELNELMLILKKRGIENLLIEGGQTVIYNFLKKRLVDELYVYISNCIIGGTKTPTLAGGEGAMSIDDIIKLELLSYERMGDGVLLQYKA